MAVQHPLKGTTISQFKVPVYNNTLGIEYDEEVVIDDVEFEGWYTQTPGTIYANNGDPGDPPEFDGELKIALSPEELWSMVLKWFKEPPTLTVLDSRWDAFEEDVCDRVFENTEPFEVEKEPDHDEWP